MATFFPQEIEEEILKRLPAKTLISFICVCKSWHSIITSPSFISSYNHRNSLSSSKLLFLKHPHPRRLLPSSSTTIHFSLSSNTFLESTTIKVPQWNGDHKLGFGSRPIRVELVTSNSINGVICIIVDMGISGQSSNFDMFMWNPSTGESVKIPNSEVSGLFYGVPMVRFICGFGFIGGDYRIVRVSYLNTVKPTTEVYSLKKNRWRDLTLFSRSCISSNILWASSNCTFVDGIGYWAVFSNERKDEFFLMGFQFGGNCFKRVDVPEECVDGREMRYHSLWVYKGMLAVSVLRFAEFDSDVTRHYIWVMKGDEESQGRGWCNLFNIDLVGGPRRPVVSFEGGELLLLGEDDGEHALYDPVSEEVKTVDISDVDTVVLYTESLVSLSELMPK